MFNSKTKEQIIESVATTGMALIQISGFVLFIMAIVYLFQGVLLERALSLLMILNSASLFIFFFFILILLPLAIFKKTRLFSGVVMLLSSYIFGLDLWIYSAIITYSFWGWIAFFIGIFLAGVGVLPIAMLATIFHGEWSTFWELIFMTIITFGARFFGLYLINKTEENDYAKEATQIENTSLEDSNSTITDAETESFFEDENDKDDTMYTFCTCGEKLEWKKPNSLPAFCKYCGNKLT